MEQLRASERTLRAFLSTHEMTEAMLLSDGVSEQQYLQEEEAKLAEQHAAVDREIAALSEQRGRIICASEEASAQGAEISAIRQRIASAKEALLGAKQSLVRIRKTQELLDAAKTAMSARYLSLMQQRFRFYYAAMTGQTEDEVRSLTLDASLNARIEGGGALRPMESFSRGMRDLTDFCVRLALIDALYTADDGAEELPPLLLDDPFVNLDSTHLQAAKMLLERAAKRFQILYVVCHASRM